MPAGAGSSATLPTVGPTGPSLACLSAEHHGRLKLSRVEVARFLVTFRGRGLNSFIYRLDPDARVRSCAGTAGRNAGVCDPERQDGARDRAILLFLARLASANLCWRSLGAKRCA